MWFKYIPPPEGVYKKCLLKCLTFFSIVLKHMFETTKLEINQTVSDINLNRFSLTVLLLGHVWLLLCNHYRQSWTENPRGRLLLAKKPPCLLLAKPPSWVTSDIYPSVRPETTYGKVTIL